MAERPSFIFKLSESGLLKINGIFYGWPGCGKTALLGTGDSTLLIMDSDTQGTATASAMGSEADATLVTNYTKLEEVYQYLANEDHGYKTVAWDSTTMFMDRTLTDELLRDAYMANPSKQDPDVASQREYLKSQTRIGRYFRQFAELDINFISIMHVMPIETPEGEVMWAPFLPGKEGEFSKKIQGYANLIGFMYAKENDQKETDRFIRFKQNEQYVAKDRFHCFPAVIKNPTLPQLLERVEMKRQQVRSKQMPVKKAVAKKAAVMRRSTNAS
jgi:hypothetical protein